MTKILLLSAEDTVVTSELIEKIESADVVLNVDGYVEGSRLLKAGRGVEVEDANA